MKYPSILLPRLEVGTKTTFTQYTFDGSPQKRALGWSVFRVTPVGLLAGKSNAKFGGVFRKEQTKLASSLHMISRRFCSCAIAAGGASIAANRTQSTRQFDHRTLRMRFMRFIYTFYRLIEIINSGRMAPPGMIEFRYATSCIEPSRAN